MSCPECKGTGFVLMRKDVTTKAGIPHKNVEIVRRCSSYQKYFREVMSIGSLPDQPVLYHQSVCDAASSRHQAIIDKDKKAKGRHGDHL